MMRDGAAAATAPTHTHITSSSRILLRIIKSIYYTRLREFHHHHHQPPSLIIIQKNRDDALTHNVSSEPPIPNFVSFPFFTKFSKKDLSCQNLSKHFQPKSNTFLPSKIQHSVLKSNHIHISRFPKKKVNKFIQY